MTDWAIDASALLALLKREPGADQVAAALMDGAAMSAVNLSEVVAKLTETGMPSDTIHESLDHLGLDVVPFDADLAFATGLLRESTRSVGVSLGDRACIALARRLDVPALTADQAWSRLNVGVEVTLIR